MKVSYHDGVDVFWPYTQTGKRLDQAAYEISVTRLGTKGVKPGIDQDHPIRVSDQPDLVEDQERPVVGVRPDEVVRCGAHRLRIFNCVNIILRGFRHGWRSFIRASAARKWGLKRSGSSIIGK